MSTSVGSEAYLREMLEKSFREAKTLKSKVESLEKENHALKKSLYELSVRYNAIAYQKHQPFSLDFLGNGPRNDQPTAPQLVTKTNGPLAVQTAFIPQDSSSTVSSKAHPQQMEQVPSTPGLSNSRTVSFESSSDEQGYHVGAMVMVERMMATTQDDVLAVATSSLVNASTVTGTTSHAHQLQDNRVFAWKMDLKGHSGPVYACQFSPSGHFIASGSFDKTIRIWDLSNSATTSNMNASGMSQSAITPNAQGLPQSQQASSATQSSAPSTNIPSNLPPTVSGNNIANSFQLLGHAHVVSDVHWGHDSRSLVSGSFDATCKLWDIETHAKMLSIDADGFIQCVMNLSPHLFGFSTSRNSLCIVDKRTGSIVGAQRDTSTITSIVSLSSNEFMTGDALGHIKTWDIRAFEMQDPTKILHQSSSFVDSARKSILSMAALPMTDRVLVAANYSDNVLRLMTYVNDEGPSPSSPNLPTLTNPSTNAHASTSTAKPASLSLTSTFKQHRNMNLSIKTALTKYTSKYDTQRIYIASGSVDHCVYVYPWKEGISEQKEPVVQRLEGHLDRVHAVSFHPEDTLLCSGSADTTLKVWQLSKKKK